MKRLQMLAIVFTVLLTSLFSVNLASGAAGDLGIVKTADVTEAMPGDTITYTITVTNFSDNDILATVFDTLLGPIGTDTVMAGQSKDLLMEYTVPADFCGDLTNTATVTWEDGCYSAYYDHTVKVICEAKCETVLKAGKKWDAGVVTISDDGEDLFVKFTTTDGWELEETHLYVGTTEPKKAAPGQFPYSNPTGEYTVSLENWGVECGDTLYIAAHAVVSKDGQSETAWADVYGIPFSKGWAMYIMYEMCEGCIDVQP